MKGLKFVVFELVHSLPLTTEKRMELLAHVAHEFGVEESDHPLLKEASEHPELLTLREPVRTRDEKAEYEGAMQRAKDREQAAQRDQAASTSYQPTTPSGTHDAFGVRQN